MDAFNDLNDLNRFNEFKGISTKILAILAKRSFYK